MKRLYLSVILITLIGLTGCSSTPKLPPAETEQLLYSIPENYVLGYQIKESNMLLMEFIPKGETSENWTEMITLQTFYGLDNMTPKEYAARVKKAGASVCPGIKSTLGKETLDNGYQAYSWKQVCDLNPNTKREEATLLKAIAGRRNLYVIQKAWGYYPDQKETQIWSEYIKNTILCNSEKPTGLCTGLKKSQKTEEN